jgi:DNA-binding IclR family transcriptional regulator
MSGSKIRLGAPLSVRSTDNPTPDNEPERFSESGETQTALDRAGVQSVGIAATILKALAAGGGVLALKHLAAATGMPRAKVHRYLASLRASGLITQDPETGHYAIGPAAVTIGLVGLGRLSPVRQLNDALPRLRNRVNETVTAAIWGDTGPTIIAIEESDHVVTMNVRIGSVLPLTTTAIGRVFLAYLPPSLTQDFVVAEQARGTASSPGPGEDVLVDIRERRLSGAPSALLPGVDAIAAPVFDVRGKLVAVICVVGRSGGTLCSWDGPVARALDQAARNLSRQLGCLDVATEPAPDQGTRSQSARSA